MEHVVNEPNVDIVKLAVGTINTINSHDLIKSCLRLSIDKITTEYNGGGSSYYVLVIFDCSRKLGR